MIIMWTEASHGVSASLPLAGEVGAQRRVRVLSSRGVSLRKHPLPNPPPQAGEGAHLHLGLKVSTRGRHG
ncbi:hypothetical protein C7U92_03655 [Bradyrhizobium sp. WBOS7]|nr:hypothetical protein [Bradyrhizobium sp. WBOS2]MDD1569734.1 hypothetical protein [Bradyrhizobium sp. WBOS1]MDD1575833.1 hypothetical protein [Bradyrhizobium sp. WBOS7]MDD1599578.1 hypothetical protein [Bradyrhizobium sp. WBOS16]